MIQVNILGRLGNQLFQYAFAYSSAKRLQTRFLLNHSNISIANRSDPLLIDRYFSLPSYEFITYKIRPLILGSPARTKQFSNLNAPESNIDLLEDDYFYKGFYQSEKYFIEFREEILKEFAIKKIFLEDFEYLYGKIFMNNTIVIHVRRGDYKYWNISELGLTDPSLPMQYYKDFISSIEDIDRYKVIFVGDDLKPFQEEYKNRDYYFFKNSEIIDFLIIYHADIVCLSNSTFCWWAAYLNHKKDKKIYAPKYWLGYKVEKEFPISILPKDWNLIDP